MRKGLGRFTRRAAEITVCVAGMLALLIWQGATPVWAATILAILFGVLAAAYVVVVIFRKLFPNAVGKHEEELQNRTFVGDGDE